MIQQLVNIHNLKNFICFDIFISKLDCIFHRIMGQFRLEGSPGGLCSNVLPKAGSVTGSDQVAWGFYLSTLENETETSQLLWAMAKCVVPLQPAWIPPFLSFACCLLSSHRALLWRVWVCVLGDILICIEGSPSSSSPPQSCLFPQTEQAPILHPLLTGQVQPHRQPPAVLLAIWWTHSSLKYWEILRQKIPSPNILLSWKKTQKCQNVLFCPSNMYIFHMSWIKIPFPIGLFSRHIKVPNPALFVQL